MTDDESRKKPTGDYSIGYCRPPESGRFQKGKTGNPAGRPKGSNKGTNGLNHLLNSKITVSVNCEKSRVTFGEAIDRRLAQKAAEGNMQAIREINRLRELNKTPDQQKAEIEVLKEKISSLQKELAKVREEKKGGIMVLPMGPQNRLGQMIHYTTNPEKIIAYMRDDANTDELRDYIIRESGVMRSPETNPYPMSDDLEVMNSYMGYE